MESLIKDVRFAVRSFLKRRGFSLATKMDPLEALR